mmetsp:Transcript_24212/g.69674  ORF Transcript_24212/g.69674 Transcript_24212/m.69674 type:complete len:331 (+) Transcript_24212:863-1855(+)
MDLDRVQAAQADLAPHDGAADLQDTLLVVAGSSTTGGIRRQRALADIAPPDRRLREEGGGGRGEPPPRTRRRWRGRRRRQGSRRVGHELEVQEHAAAVAIQMQRRGHGVLLPERRPAPAGYAGRRLRHPGKRHRHSGQCRADGHRAATPRKVPFPRMVQEQVDENLAPQVLRSQLEDDSLVPVGGVPQRHTASPLRLPADCDSGANLRLEIAGANAAPVLTEVRSAVQPPRSCDVHVQTADGRLRGLRRDLAGPLERRRPSALAGGIRAAGQRRRRLPCRLQLCEGLQGVVRPQRLVNADGLCPHELPVRASACDLRGQRSRQHLRQRPL